MILKPLDNTFEFPEAATPSGLFKYIAEFNGYMFFDTDITGYTPDEITQDYFFCNRIDLVTKRQNTSQFKYDGFLFVAVPTNIGQEVNASSFDNGQFTDVVEGLITKEFIRQLEKYFICSNIEMLINNLRPLYNSVKYTKATNCTGVEISYSLWI